MKIKFKNNKGFTSIDLSIAMIVLLIFVSIMTSISYNAYMTSAEAKRTAVALNYAVDIFENIDILSYSEVDASVDMFYIEDLKEFMPSEQETNRIKGSIGTYDITLKIEDYLDKDVIKIITLTIEYPISKDKTEKVELQRLKIQQTTT